MNLTKILPLLILILVFLKHGSDARLSSQCWSCIRHCHNKFRIGVAHCRIGTCTGRYWYKLYHCRYCARKQRYSYRLCRRSCRLHYCRARRRRHHRRDRRRRHRH